MNLEAYSCITDYASWLRRLAEKGGEGVVNNIDARSLVRVAHIMERQAQIIQIERGEFYDLACRVDELADQVADLRRQMAQTTDSEAPALLRLAQVMQKTGLSRSGIYSAVSRRTFIKPVKVGPRNARWPVKVVEDWIESTISDHVGGQR